MCACVYINICYISISFNRKDGLLDILNKNSHRNAYCTTASSKYPPRQCGVAGEDAHLKVQGFCLILVTSTSR